jgi:two-component system sensor histidine kinase HydH
MLRLYRAPSTKDPLGSAPSGQPRVHPRFRLSRWFGVLSLGLVAVITAASVSLLSWFVSQRMLQQEGQLTRDFVHSLVLAETPLQAFLAAPGPVSVAAALSLQHLARMPDMLRANLYDRSRHLIWSSDPTLRGRSFDGNPELDRALAGELVAKREEHDHDSHGKAEHRALPGREAMFVEIYVPVRDPATGSVLGAIEFYKRPQALAEALLAELRALHRGGRRGGGALLFAALFGLVRRADRTIRAQQRLLVDEATLAALGEMSSAVAHGIRNPLASDPQLGGADARRPAGSRQCGGADIVAQCDRLEAWVRELLAYAADAPLRAEPLSLAPLVRSACDEVAAAAGRRRVLLHAGVPDDLPPVQADPPADGAGAAQRGGQCPGGTAARWPCALRRTGRWANRDPGHPGRRCRAVGRSVRTGRAADVHHQAAGPRGRTRAGPPGAAKARRAAVDDRRAGRRHPGRDPAATCSGLKRETSR